MGNGDIKGLTAAHRQSGDGAMGAVIDHPIVLLDIRHDVRDEVLSELIGGRRTARTRRANIQIGAYVRRASPRSWAWLFWRDEIVENEARSPYRSPRLITVARAVKQIENGIFSFPVLIPGRSVDVHSAEISITP